MHHLLIDSDVILDVLLKRNPHYEHSPILFTLIDQKKFTGYTTPVIFSNISYLLEEHCTSSEIRQILKNIRKNIFILTQNSKTVDDALDSKFSDFEDALQYFAAEHQKLDCIISRNKRDYTTGTIPSFTPREFLQTVK